MSEDDATMTHKQLVRQMQQWLKRQGSTVVMAELVTRNSETPDVIGWEGAAFSTLIECKISRANFFQDVTKQVRRCEEMGMGDLRYFACPKGLLDPSDLPKGWGLLEVGKHVSKTVQALRMASNKRNECVMLMSALRRLQLSTAVYVVSEDRDTSPLTLMQNDAKVCTE